MQYRQRSVSDELANLRAIVLGTGLAFSSCIQRRKRGAFKPLAKATYAKASRLPHSRSQALYSPSVWAW